MIRIQDGMNRLIRKFVASPIATLSFTKLVIH